MDSFQIVPNLEIRVKSFDWDDVYAVLFRTQTSRGKEVVFEEYNRTKPVIDAKPTFSLSKLQAQQLIDELWYIGLRPKGYKGSNTIIEVLEKRIEDLQKMLEYVKGKLDLYSNASVVRS
jgi:hypothetical protein